MQGLSCLRDEKSCGAEGEAALNKQVVLSRRAPFPFCSHLPACWQRWMSGGRARRLAKEQWQQDWSEDPGGPGWLQGLQHRGERFCASTRGSWTLLTGKLKIGFTARTSTLLSVITNPLFSVFGPAPMRHRGCPLTAPYRIWDTLCRSGHLKGRSSSGWALAQRGAGWGTAQAGLQSGQGLMKS